MLSVDHPVSMDAQLPTKNYFCCGSGIQTALNATNSTNSPVDTDHAPARNYLRDFLVDAQIHGRPESNLVGGDFVSAGTVIRVTNVPDNGRLRLFHAKVRTVPPAMRFSCFHDEHLGRYSEPRDQVVVSCIAGADCPGQTHQKSYYVAVISIAGKSTYVSSWNIIARLGLGDDSDQTRKRPGTDLAKGISKILKKVF